MYLIFLKINLKVTGIIQALLVIQLLEYHFLRKAVSIAEEKYHSTLP